MHDRPGHTYESLARRHLQNPQVLATIFGELLRRRNLRFLRLSHQAFRKHSLSLFLSWFQSFVEVVVVLDPWLFHPRSRLLGASLLPPCLCHQRRRGVVVEAMIWKIVLAAVVVVVRELVEVRELVVQESAAQESAAHLP